jgi:LigXa C-terminal domain like
LGIGLASLRSFSPEEHAQNYPGALSNTGGGSEYLPPTSRPYGAFYTKANHSNDYLLDRSVQRTQTFSGIPTVGLQDTAVTESMGAIYERDREHLGTSDKMIIRTRLRLLGIARAMRDQGTPPPAAFEPERLRVRSCSVFLPRDVDWVAATESWREARGELPKERIEVAVRQ